MGVRALRWLLKPGRMLALLPHVRLASRLLRDPAVPLYLKSVPVLAALYVVSPLDVIPDFIPGLGQLDDLGLALLALTTFVRFCPERAVAFHREAIAEKRPFAPMMPDVIDAEWRRS